MTHDYQPEWDYDTVPEDGEVAPEVKSVLGGLRDSNLFEALRISVPRVAYTDGSLNRLGRYIDGTKDEPVLILDIKRLKEAAAKYDLTLDLVVETTILHELAHAADDVAGRRTSEREAEEFARSFYYTRNITPRYSARVRSNIKAKRSTAAAPKGVRRVG